jgi:hypothetical protein
MTCKKLIKRFETNELNAFIISRVYWIQTGIQSSSCRIFLQRTAAIAERQQKATICSFVRVGGGAVGAVDQTEPILSCEHLAVALAELAALRVLVRPAKQLVLLAKVIAVRDSFVTGQENASGAVHERERSMTLNSLAFNFEAVGWVQANHFKNGVP